MPRKADTTDKASAPTARKTPARKPKAQAAPADAPVLTLDADQTDAAHGNPERPQDTEFSQLVDHNYLQEGEFGTVAETLQRNLATTLSLYLKFKKFHWDIRGRMFRDLHLAYDEMAAEVFESVDVLAERLVMLGGSPVAAPSEIERHSTIRVPTETIRDAREQLTQLVEDHNLITRTLRDDSQKCDDAGDPATADLYNGLLLQHDEHRWMLQAILDDGRLN